MVHIRAVARDIVSDVLLLHGYINHLGVFWERVLKKKNKKKNIRENVETMKRRQLRAQKNNISGGYNIMAVWHDVHRLSRQ